MNHFFFPGNVNKTSIWDRAEFSSQSNQTQPLQEHSERVQVSTQRMQTTEGRGKNRNYLQGSAASVPTMMKSLASVLLELLSQNNPLCALFSDSQWSTINVHRKNTTPFSLLCPQLHNGNDRFLPALNC